MADVGVLNLQIHDNSEQAVKGLEALDGVLLHIRHVVNGALGLNKVASSLKKLTDTVNNELHGSTIVKLGQLADELSKLKGMGDMNIRIGGGTSIESIRDAVRETMQDMSGINTGFDDIKGRAYDAKGGIDGMNASLRDTQELMQNKGWAGGIDQFREMFEEYSRIRSALSLPAGDQTGISTQVENGWTAWKEGAIEVEGTVSDAMDTVTARLGEPIQYLTGMSSEIGNLNDYLGQTNGLMEEMAKNTSPMSSGEFAIIPYTGVKEEIEGVVEETKEAANQTMQFGNTLNGASAQAKAYYASLEDAFNGIRYGRKVENDLMSKWLHGEGTAREQLYALTSAARMFGMTIDEVKAKVAELLAQENAIGSMDMSGATSSLDQYTSSANGLVGILWNLGMAFEQLKKDIKTTGGLFSYLRNGMESMFPTITGLLKRFKSMATMRALRYVIRQIAAGFSEGVQNVYHYSKAVGTSLAPAMDQAATALQQMKNSVGAAVAPVIQALVPVLQTVVNWFITAVNYANQFFALLRGQDTWTRALPQQAEAFQDSAKEAKKASGAMKDLLADWDELNIIQSQGGSGAGSAASDTAKDYATMFEEVSEYNDTIKRIVDGIKDRFGDIWGLAKRVGLAILGWKFSNAFGLILGTLGGLVGSALTIGLVFDISTIFTKNYLDTGKPGWLIGDFVATLVGGVIAKKILGNVLGGALAKVAIPIVFAVSAAATIKALIEDTDVSVLSEESILTAITAGVEGGTAWGAALFSLGEYSAGTAIGAGIGNALFTFGVAIGLKAIATKLDVGEFTPEVIAANFLSAGAIGGGLFITELALGGTAISALTLGAGAAILTLGALFAIEAIIQKEPEKVTWGDYKATKQEIEEFVNDKLYTDPPSATVKKINLSIENLEDSKSQLTTDLTTAIGTIDALSVGILTTVDDMQAQVKTLVDSFNETTQNYQNTLQVAMTLVPVSGENGDQSASKIVKNSSNRWGALNGIMTDLGNQLADAYKVAYDARLEGNIDEAAELTIKKISEMMTRVSNAIATGQSKAKAGNAIRMQIENLSKETLDGIIDEYKVQRDALIEELTKLRKESAEGVLAQQYAFEELAEYALKDAGGNQKDETYLYYKRLADEAKADYEALISNLHEDAEKAADRLVDDDTMDKVRKFMVNSIANSFDMNDIEGVIASAGYDPDRFAQFITKTLTGGDEEKQKAEIHSFIDDLLADLVGAENYDTYKKAIDENILSYGDLISEDLMNSIADKLGISGKDRDLWNQYVSEVLGTKIKTPGMDNTELDSSVQTAKETISGLVKFIKEEMNDLSGTGFDVYAAFHGNVDTIPVEPRASGGFVRSGDLVMANENGQFEMMGRMGSQPVVANNQQIVSGISQGVATANEGVETRLRAIENMLSKLMQKEFVARAVPSSGWGQHNAESSGAFERVTG